MIGYPNTLLLGCYVSPVPETANFIPSAGVVMLYYYGEN